MEENFEVPAITIVGEQDGDAERDFKYRLIERFRTNLHVNAAYLVRVRYAGSPDEKVALALNADEAGQPQLVKLVSGEFRQMFKTSESLDIVFLNGEQQESINSIAEPFYRQNPHVS